MKKYSTVYISREKFSIVAILLFLLTFSVGHVSAQKTLFFDNFGSPEEATVRRIWPYMPTDVNTFLFANPTAPNIGGKPFSEAKAIENNFYAVVAPRHIYSSVGLNNAQNANDLSDNVPRIWSDLVNAGDITEGHDNNGGAMVINAGTTLASFYVRLGNNLERGHYYKLSYQLFVQNGKVVIKHHITSPSGNSSVAVHESPENGQQDGIKSWKEQSYWFYMPAEGCSSGSYGISISNAYAADSGNDFAIDDLLFEDWGTEIPTGVSAIEIVEIECNIAEPVANDDEKLNQPSGSNVQINLLANDLLSDGSTSPQTTVQPGAWNNRPYSATINILVPPGLFKSIGNFGDTDMPADKLIVPGEGIWEIKEGWSHDGSYIDNYGGGGAYYFAYLEFTPENGFTGNPTPIYYTITDKSTGATSNRAKVTVTYVEQPVANDDNGTMETPGTSVTIDILRNDKSSSSVTPPSDVTVKLIDPHNPMAGPKESDLIVKGEGKWSYGEGVLTFTSEDGFKGTPTPILYVFEENIGNKVSNPAKVTIIVKDTPKPTPNYWMGGTTGQENEWNVPSNWTAGEVPTVEEDIEFATVDNYGTEAVADLYLDDFDQNNTGGRVIGSLINDSKKDLIITTGNQLTINGEVKDNNPDKGTIIVKASPSEPSGTLLFKNPDLNKGVGAIVEFYNQAYDCAECGFYTRSWQYFGIPVQEEDVFPSNEVYGNETVNQWVEPFNGNKWQPAPYAPDTKFEGFKGYQITNDVNTEPSGVYPFAGVLNVGDASVSLTRTSGVNYSGINLVGNSFTAAIPISEEAMTFPEGVEKTVYLFNTGTRDQWRKLNGSAINQEGYKRGQYLAVPIKLGGQEDFPDRIPSMHAFMLRATEGMGGSLGIKYDKLVKNTKVALGDGKTEIVTRSAGVETNKSLNGASGGSGSSGNSVSQQLPSLVMDVIGEESADRVWIFAKEGTSYGFDNGWDGRKMLESGIAQLYVSDEDHQDKFQVATVPSVDNLSVGFEAEADGKYTLEFALSDHWKSGVIYLFDQLTGERVQVKNGGSYSFQAKKGDNGTRFTMSYSGEDISLLDEASKIVVSSTENGKIMIQNGSSRECTVFVYGLRNGFLRQMEVAAGKEVAIEGVTSETYMVRLQNAVVHDVRRVVVK